MVRTMAVSSEVTRVKASPLLAARPVRPMRWMYASAVLGISKFMT